MTILPKSLLHKLNPFKTPTLSITEQPVDSTSETMDSAENMNKTTYLITGTSRGLGLAFVAELLKDPSTFVVATARNVETSKGLQDLAAKYPSDRLQLLTLDVSSPTSITAAAESARKILPHGLDHLISNAGIIHQPLASFEEMDLDEFAEELTFNTIYTVQLVRAFLPLVRASKDKSITIITTQLGSIEIGAMLPGLANAYSVSKAALNMLARKWSATLKLEGIGMWMMHPGWVETDIGDGIGPWMAKYSPETPKLSTAQSAENSVRLFKSVKVDEAGAFYNHDGKKNPF